MVSTRHHPRAFPPPEEAMSPPATLSRRTPRTPTSTASSSKPTSASPPPRSTARRATSRKRKSIVPKTEEDEINAIAAEAAKHIDDDTAIALTTRSHTRSPLSASTSSRATRSSRKSNASSAPAYTGSYEHTPPPFLIPWLLISVPLVIWDTIYVLGRPHTMPGGELHDLFWKPYELYGRVDYNYGWPAWSAQLGFTGAQAALNALETVMYIYYLFVIGARVVSGDGFVRGVALKSVNVFARRDVNDTSKISIKGGSDVATAVVVCFASAVMTLSKTVLYWLNEYYSGYAGIGHNSWAKLILVFIIPNGAWIVGSSYMCYVLGLEIVEAMSTGKGGRRVRRRADED